MNLFFDFIISALYAAFFQNIVLSGGYGVGEAVRIGSKPKQIGAVSLFVMIFSVLSAVSCRAFDLIPQVNALGFIEHLLIFAGTEFVLYLLVILVMIKGFKASKNFLKLVGIAGFNTLVLAIPLLDRLSSSGGIIEALGMAIGAGIAFIVATVLISVGIQRIKTNQELPESFKFTPAVFIYIGLLALAFMGFSGQSLFV